MSAWVPSVPWQSGLHTGQQLWGWAAEESDVHVYV